MAKKKKINLSGIKASFKLHEKHLIDAMKNGVIDAAITLMRASQELVPVDTGDLKASARTTITLDDEKKIIVQVSYGTSYAIYVHEDLFARHDSEKNPSTATAKFLEIPARTLQPQLRLIIMEAIQRAAKSGKAGSGN